MLAAPSLEILAPVAGQTVDRIRMTHGRRARIDQEVQVLIRTDGGGPWWVQNRPDLDGLHFALTGYYGGTMGKPYEKYEVVAVANPHQLGQTVDAIPDGERSEMVTVYRNPAPKPVAAR